MEMIAITNVYRYSLEMIVDIAKIILDTYGMI